MIHLKYHLCSSITIALTHKYGINPVELEDVIEILKKEEKKQKVHCIINSLKNQGIITSQAIEKSKLFIPLLSEEFSYSPTSYHVLFSDGSCWRHPCCSVMEIPGRIVL